MVLRNSILASLTPSVNVPLLQWNCQALGHYKGWVHHPISPIMASLSVLLWSSLEDYDIECGQENDRIYHRRPRNVFNLALGNQQEATIWW